MNKKEMLLDCIRLAYDINEYGSYVFLYVFPHIGKTSFDFHNDGWVRENGELDYNVDIMKKLEYKTYDSDTSNLGINTVEKLHEHLIHLLEKKQNENNL